MARSLKHFCTVLALYLFNQGWAAPCSLSNIVISQATTGNVIGQNPEYEVTISNNCICTQTNVNVQCAGFSSVENVDPALFKKIDRTVCLANDGEPVTQDSPIKFRYAWQTSFDLIPASSNLACS